MFPLMLNGTMLEISPMISDVVAVGSRSKEKADSYIKEVEGAENAVGYGSYDEVLEDPKVQAVYIPLPTSMHLKWVQAAAAKGKHILLEKPIAMVSTSSSPVPKISVMVFNSA